MLCYKSLLMMTTIKCKVTFSETGCFGGRCASCLPPKETVAAIILYIYIYIYTYIYIYIYIERERQ